MTPRAPRIPVPLEAEVQKLVLGLFAAVGWEAWPMSQYRASHIAEGIPDLFLMHRGGRWPAFWFETKRPRPLVTFHRFKWETWDPEPLSEAQELFRRYVLAGGGRHYWGGPREAIEAAIALGCAVRDPIAGVQWTRALGADFRSWLPTRRELKTLRKLKGIRP